MWDSTCHKSATLRLGTNIHTVGLVRSIMGVTGDIICVAMNNKDSKNPGVHSSNVASQLDC